MDATIGKLTLHSGQELKNVTMSYSTYGEMNHDKSNVILLFHVLTSSHQAVREQNGNKAGALSEGWWDAFIGPGKTLDTNQFCIICINYLGGCNGSFGPLSIDAETGQAYGEHFPDICLKDIVSSQIAVLDVLGIDNLYAVVGPSLGGLLALEFVCQAPNRTQRVISIASSHRIPPTQIAINFEQILVLNTLKEAGCDDKLRMAIARMISMKTFLVPENIDTNTNAIPKKDLSCSGYTLKHPLEKFLHWNTLSFHKRFSEHSYMALLKAMNQYQLEGPKPASLQHQRWLILSIDDDRCFPKSEQEALINYLKPHVVDYQHHTATSLSGHDSCLQEAHLYQSTISNFLSH